MQSLKFSNEAPKEKNKLNIFLQKKAFSIAIFESSPWLLPIYFFPMVIWLIDCSRLFNMQLAVASGQVVAPKKSCFHSKDLCYFDNVIAKIWRKSWFHSMDWCYFDNFTAKIWFVTVLFYYFFSKVALFEYYFDIIIYFLSLD